MKINREKLLSLYLEEVERISDLYDWKTHFEPPEIIEIICNILEDEDIIITK